jgi:Glycosyltransferase family 28 C-terminal domain
MPNIDLLYFNAGGGHRSVVNALTQVLDQQYSLHPRLVDIYETGLLNSMDVFFKSGVNIYNFMMQKGLTFIDPLYLFLSRLNVRFNHAAGVRFLETYWRQRQPDLVVSAVPLLNRMLYESLQKACPGTPFFTLIFDLADCPAHYHYWIEPNPKKRCLFCPTDRAVAQARLAGYPEAQIFQTSGSVIHPRFYDPVAVDRRVERQRLGLDPDLPTALVMFGGYGSTKMLEIAEYLERSQLNLQLIYICGRNKELANQLLRRKSRLPRIVETFTNDIPYYMHLSDFFIGKAGGQTVNEVIQMKLPVITTRNLSTLVQERYNTDWLVENQVGFALRNFRTIDQAVAVLIQPENLARYRARAASIKNQAVYEVADILKSVVDHPELL